MRHLLTILLLIAAVAHPIAHVDDPLVCACSHGVVLGVAPPVIAGIEARAASHTALAQTYVPVAAATELPARAPPIA